MQLTYKDGQVTFDVVDLLRYLKPEDMRELVSSLSCQDAVISGVCEQLLTGYTDEGFCGDDALLDKFRAVLVSRADEAVARDAEELRRRMERAEKLAADRDKAISYLWRRYHNRGSELIHRDHLYKWLSTAGKICCGEPVPAEPSEF